MDEEDHAHIIMYTNGYFVIKKSKNILEALWALTFNVRRYRHIAVDAKRLPQILEMFRKHCGALNVMPGGLEMSPWMLK